MAYFWEESCREFSGRKLNFKEVHHDSLELHFFVCASHVKIEQGLRTLRIGKAPEVSAQQSNKKHSLSHPLNSSLSKSQDSEAMDCNDNGPQVYPK